MTFFTRQDIGRVYVIRMLLPDNSIIHKIGMCKSARSVDRMMEILRSWFTKYRFVPYSELRLDMECSHPQELETYIHRVLKARRFKPFEKVDGGTEMFKNVNEQRLIHHLRQFNVGNFDTPLGLTDADYNALGRLIAP